MSAKNQQYMRKYRILITNTKTQKTKDISELRVTFEIHKVLSGEPGYSKIIIYNLKQKTIEWIKKGLTVVIEAGYENTTTGMIFNGDIVQPILRWEDSVTSALTLICKDGDQFLKNSFTIKTLAAGSTGADQVQAVISTQTGSIPAGALTESLQETASARPKVLFGSSAYYLQQIAKANDAMQYIEDGVVNIVKAKDYANNTAVELSPATGLIGTPEQTEDGVSGQCLINPRIKLNTRIYLSSDTINQQEVSDGETKASPLSTSGVYKIIGLDISGDTDGDEWYMTFEAVSDPSTKTTKLSSQSLKNPWK